MTKKTALKKLNTYFKYETSSLLQILDIPSKAAAKRGGYTGVTAEYLLEYVVPGIDKSLFLECINELLTLKVVAYIRCNNINRIVFEKYISDYDHYRSNTCETISNYTLNESLIVTNIEDDYEEE
jgi:hypothetical protein